MLTQDSRLVPELIPIGRDVVRSSLRDWLVRERSAICFLISQSYGVSLGVRIRYSLHGNFRAKKLLANFVAPKCWKLQYFAAVSIRHMTKYACKAFPL